MTWVRVKIERLTQIIGEDDICRYLVATFHAAIVAHSKGSRLHGTTQRLPDTIIYVSVRAEAIAQIESYLTIW